MQLDVGSSPSHCFLRPLFAARLWHHPRLRRHKVTIILGCPLRITACGPAALAAACFAQGLFCSASRSHGCRRRRLRLQISRSSLALLSIELTCNVVFACLAAQDWSGVLNTTWYSNSCMQHSNAFTLLTDVSEDCLYLNVYTPYPQPATPVPIMVFFYGKLARRYLSAASLGADPTCLRTLFDPPALFHIRRWKLGHWQRKFLAVQPRCRHFVG